MNCVAVAAAAAPKVLAQVMRGDVVDAHEVVVEVMVVVVLFAGQRSARRPHPQAPSRSHAAPAATSAGRGDPSARPSLRQHSKAHSHCT